MRQGGPEGIPFGVVSGGGWQPQVAGGGLDSRGQEGPRARGPEDQSPKGG